MQLTYRGQSDETSAIAVDLIAAGETTAFMDRPYARKQFTVAQRQQLTELTYRGIRYAR
ncbi:MAG: DUF4278 domain-containing protein [Nodosilinea sp.]